jgi:hypothetical protein
MTGPSAQPKKESKFEGGWYSSVRQISQASFTLKNRSKEAGFFRI